MLKLKYLYENYDLALFAISKWKEDLEGTEELLKYFRISSNAVYPFMMDGKVRYIRLAPVEEKLLQNLFGEIEFIQYIRSKGYNALEPVLSLDGNYIEIIDTKWGKYYANVFEKVLGEQLEDIELNNDLVYGYGKSLGLLHRLSKDFSPKTKKWSFEEALNWIAQELSSRPGQERALKELESIRLLLAKLPRDNSNYGLVHYDFEPDNVFYNEKDNSFGVIDFEDGMYHWFALDIEQALSCLSELKNGEGFETVKEAFLRGYKSQFAIAQDMINNLPLFRRFINLYSYTRITRSIEEQVMDEPDWMINIRHKLSNKIEAIAVTWI